MLYFFFFSSRRRHTRWNCDWSSDVCSSDLGGGGIVRAIEVNVRAGVQFFEAAGPDRVCDPPRDGIIGDLKAAVLEEPRGGDGVQGVLELETAGKARGDFENFARGCIHDAHTDSAVLHGFTIDAAAQADFEDGEVYALAGKIFESHGGHAFEISGVGAQFAGSEELFDQRMDVSEGLGETLVADLRAIHADAFVDFFEVRRGIQSRSKASVAKDGFEERGSGTFAVGAGDVGAGISAVGAAEALAEDGDVFEIELCGRGLGRSGQFAAEGKQVADRGFVFHFISAQKEVEGAGDEGLELLAVDDGVEETVFEEEFGALKSFGEFLADGLLDDARAG